MAGLAMWSKITARSRSYCKRSAIAKAARRSWEKKNCPRRARHRHRTVYGRLPVPLFFERAVFLIGKGRAGDEQGCPYLTVRSGLEMTIRPWPNQWRAKIRRKSKSLSAASHFEPGL